MRTRILATIGAVIVAASALTATPAMASPQGTATVKHNVLREWCKPYNATVSLKRDCVFSASDDSRTFIVLNHAGHRVNITNPTVAMRYLRKHATPCAQEDSNACFWDASRRGNGVGSTFVTIGHGLYWPKDLPQYGAGTTQYLSDLTHR